jgi:hypothetical protein
VIRGTGTWLPHPERQPYIRPADRAFWVVQQVREAFPFDTAPKHFIFDRDSTFSAQVVGAVKAFGAKPTRTAPGGGPLRPRPRPVQTELSRATRQVGVGYNADRD